MTKESNWVVVPSGKKGFASMTPEKRKEIAILGGKAVPAEKRAFSTKKGLAAKAGAKGGKTKRPRSFTLDPDLASRASRMRKPKA
jgi:general stress protein YciG